MNPPTSSLQSQISNPLTLLILPGWGGSHETWADFVELAKPHFADVHVIDLPCFGTEPCPTDVWGVAEYASFVKEQIQSLRHLERSEAKSRDLLHGQRDSSTADSFQASSARNDGEIVLLGHSFGGAVAAHLVAKNPGLVDKLILSGAAIYRPKNRLRRFIFGVIAKFGKLIFRLPIIEKGSVFAKKVLYRAADSPDYNETSGIKRDIFQKIIREDKQSILSDISAETLILWGTHDTYTPFKQGKKLAKALPHATFVPFTHGKHGLHIQQPQRMLDTVRSWVTQS